MPTTIDRPAHIQYGNEQQGVDLEQLVKLRSSAGWAELSMDALVRQIEGSRWLVTASDGSRLVGFARAISDGVTNGYVATVVVDPGYRRRGIGTAILLRLLDGRDDVRWVLRANAEVAKFYQKLGFEAAPDMLRRERQLAAP